MKKNKQTPFLDLYREWMNRQERIPTSGLCGCVPNSHRDIFNLVTPTKKDMRNIIDDGTSILWWGEERRMEPGGIFNERRQHIILFCAAINGEFD